MRRTLMNLYGKIKESIEMTPIARQFVVTPTFLTFLFPLADIAAAIAERKWALASPKALICGRRQGHARRSRAKLGAPTIVRMPPNPEMARIPPELANKHN